MSKFLLTAALGLGSLAGFSGAGRGEEAAPSARAAATLSGQSAETRVGDDYVEIGPFILLTTATEVRDYYFNLGAQAEIHTDENGQYWIRVEYDE